MILVATHDIAKGDELYISYLGVVESTLRDFAGMENTIERRQHLMKEFGFHCMCELCVRTDG